MVRYSFLTQAYVWGEGEPSRRLPANLAMPFVGIADALGVPPVMNYAGYVLDNWVRIDRSEEHTSELQSLMRISYAVFCLKKKIRKKNILKESTKCHKKDIQYTQ